MPHALLRKAAYLLLLSYLLRNTCDATLAPTVQRAWQSPAWQSPAWRSSCFLLPTSRSSYLADLGKNQEQSPSPGHKASRCRELQNQRPELPEPFVRQGRSVG